MPDPTDTACFSLNDYKEYCGSLLKYVDADGSIKMTVEVDPGTWETADLLMFFNLRLDKRHPGTISGTKPVQISMFLDPNIYNELKVSNSLLTDKTAYIKADKDHPMRNTSAWFATEVTEEVELPEELKKMGTVREGFTTHWKKN
jgi:hypothetical protein